MIIFGTKNHNELFNSLLIREVRVWSSRYWFLPIYKVKIEYLGDENKKSNNPHMRLVRYTKEDIKLGNIYWIDSSTEYTDEYDNTYAKVYLDNTRKNLVGEFRTDNFETIFRYLKYGRSISDFINTDTSFILGDIIEWCLDNMDDSIIARKIISYISDNGLAINDNMNKEFLVKYKSFREQPLEEYRKYLGYYLELV